MRNDIEFIFNMICRFGLKLICSRWDPEEEVLRFEKEEIQEIWIVNIYFN
jgi:hypothetical protein